MGEGEGRQREQERRGEDDENRDLAIGGNPGRLPGDDAGVFVSGRGGGGET